MKTLNNKTVKRSTKRNIHKAERQAFKKGLDPRTVKIKGRKASGGYVFTQGKSVIID